MHSITECLTQNGIDTLALSLHGHGDNYHSRPDQSSAQSRLDSFRYVSAGLWQQEAYAAYRIVQAFAEQQHLPLFLAAFSLGGLVACDLLASAPDVRFDRIVLWAPALTPRRWTWFLRPLAPWPHLRIPSLAPPDYRANRRTTLAAYTALYATVDHLAHACGVRLNVPTLIFVDPDDELVSYTGLQQMIAKKGLQAWSIHPVRKSGRAAQAHYHHLIVDAQTAGYTTWDEMAKLCHLHLTGSASAEKELDGLG